MSRLKNIIFGAYKNWCKQKNFFVYVNFFKNDFSYMDGRPYENWLKNKYFSEFSYFILQFDHLSQI
jgi:hypothetical protein